MLDANSPAIEFALKAVIYVAAGDAIVQQLHNTCVVAV